MARRYIDTMLWTIFKIVTGIRSDTREPYLLDDNDQPLALVMEGKPGRTPNHEDYSHDGTPHQNPDVRREWRRVRLLGVTVGFRRVEVRSYPLTVAPDGRRADLDDIEDQIDDTRLRGGQRAYLAPMDSQTVKGALRVEDEGQRAAGVPRWMLKRGRAFEPYDNDDNYIDWGF